MKERNRDQLNGGRAGASFVANPAFVLRTPILPLTTFLEWAAAPDPRKYLLGCLDRAFAHEALFLASPGLVEARVSAGDNDKALEGVELSLARYLARMAGRATPFGLFAGISIGSLGQVTSLHLSERSEYYRISRLDNGYVFKLAEEMVRKPAVRNNSRFFANSSIWSVGEQIRYLVSRIEHERVAYEIVSAESTPYLIEVLRHARKGRTRQELASSIIALDCDIVLEEALEYVDKLIDEQVLVSDMLPPITGGSPVSSLIEKMTAFGLTREVEVLSGAARALARLDSYGIGNDIGEYHRIAESLGSLSVPTEAGRLFQVDMVKPGNLVLENEVGPRVLRTVEALARVRAATREHTLMETFCRQFTERYEDRVVPLAEALDEENGIGFDSRSAPGSEGSPLLVGLPVRVPTEKDRNEWSRFEEHMFSRVAEAIRANVREISLDEQDLAAMESATVAPLPDAFMAQIRLGNSGSGTSILHMLSSGPSGAQVLGRFCHLSSELEALVRGHLELEEQQRNDVVFAEIVHVSEGRLGNVVCRPLLRKYEIPYLGRSGADEHHQIPLDDLHLVVRRGRVVLLSRRLGKEIVPRMANAHNFDGSSLPVYRFLCSLQASSGYYWSWRALSGASWLPRVRIGDVIVSRERWKLGSSDLTAITSALRSGKIQEYAKRLWERLRLPRFVVVADGDNELPIDIENPLLVRAFADLVEGRKWIQLLEMFPAPGESPVRGPEGQYANEAIVLFARSPLRIESDMREVVRGAEAVEILRRDASICTAGALRRSFMPGSEWLYLKIYTDPAGADIVLLEVVAPCLRELAEQKKIARWFFVRYQDPHHHLRVRVMGDPRTLSESVMPMLEQRLRPLMGSGVVSRVQCDTYHREIERYGGPEGMVLCEELFWYESDAIASIIAHVPRRDRWMPALLAAESLLECLGIRQQERHRLYTHSRDQLAKEFGTQKELVAKIGEFYRRERVTIDSIVIRAPGVLDVGEGQIEAILRQRSMCAAPVVARLRELEERRGLWSPVYGLASHLLHMQFNRIFHASPRAQEFVCYDLLRRILEARKARHIGGEQRSMV